jgi:hypothetical protein
MSDPTPFSTAQDMRDALNAIDAKISDARTVKNNSTRTADALKMTDCIDKLKTARTAIYDEVYSESVDGPAFADAVNKITAAGKDLNTVASNMKSATDFISSLAGFLGAVDKVLPVLKGYAG